MKCLILAAGYATRLYPLTENFPKPLLKVGRKSILDWLIDDIGDACDEFVVISNHKFYRHFTEWAASRSGKEKITVLDDGTSSNETRLGAVCDIRFAIDAIGNTGDLLVIAGDNLLDFSLRRFVSYARERKASCVMRYSEPDKCRLAKSGVIEVGPDDRILSMQEKPSEPRSNWCCPPFYYYTADAAGRLAQGIEAGCGTDAPGSFIAWLASEFPVYAMEMPGRRYDIGNLESYRSVCETYK